LGQCDLMLIMNDTSREFHPKERLVVVHKYTGTRYEPFYPHTERRMRQKPGYQYTSVTFSSTHEQT